VIGVDPLNSPIETQTVEFKRLNPHGQNPVLIDAEEVIWDSMAILVYLASCYGYPKNKPERYFLGLMAQPLLSYHCTRPAAKQCKKIQGAFLGSPPAIFSAFPL
jgi:glutathione S-transferase